MSSSSSELRTINAILSGGNSGSGLCPDLAPEAVTQELQKQLALIFVGFQFIQQ